MEKSEKVALLSAIVLVGFFLAVVFHYVLGFYMGQEYSFNTFLSEPYRAFDDFTSILPRIKGFAPYVEPANWQNYFPLSYLILEPFALIKDKILAYSIFASIFVGFFLYWNINNFKCKKFSGTQNFMNIFILTFMSYPFLCIIDRGNFDMVVFILSMVFVLFLQKKKYAPAAIILGVINALKPFSLLFLFIFLFDKKYREFFLSIATSFLLVVGGFFLFKGNVFDQISVMIGSFIWTQKFFLADVSNGISNSSSLFASLKFLLCSFNNIIPFNTLLNIYNYVFGVLTLLTIVFAWREKIFWKRISLLTCYMLALPQMVFDYKLILLFIPLYLFVNEKEKSKFDLIYLILFSLMLIPKRYIMFLDPTHGVNFILFSTVVNPFILLTIMGLISIEQFKFKKEEK